MESSSTVPKLIDQCEVSSSSSESSSLFINSINPCIISNFDNFEISNFHDFEFYLSVPVDNSVHSLESSQLLQKEADCEDIKKSSIGDDGGTLHQDSILQMLTLISNQMMSNNQDLQNPFIQTESKFTIKLQDITQHNETFKQEICADMQRIRSVAPSPPILSSLMNNTSVTSTVVPTTSTAQVTLPPVISSSTNQDFQNQMMALLNATFSKLTNVISEKSSKMK